METYLTQGRRAPLSLRACPWLSYSAPLALLVLANRTFEAKLMTTEQN